jgi:hypothetical protein
MQFRPERPIAVFEVIFVSNTSIRFAGEKINLPFSLP